VRVFLAVTPEPGLAATAHAWGQAVAAALDTADRRALSWVPRERIHVTLRFYGELAPARVDALRRALGEQPWRAAPFDLGLGPAGTFPAGGRPRVLWLGLTEGADALMALRRELDARPDAAPVDAEAGETFSPHLTIARVRRPTPGIGPRLRDAVGRIAAPRARTAVAALTLYQSVPSPSGATYVVLARIPLAGATPASG
jgi:RNA 2',3'-cyclic 3'-phosphodiesterase